MMGFATRSRRATPEPHTLTAVPFAAAGDGVGDLCPAVIVETPDDETVLVVCAETERIDRAALDRCALALDAFCVGFGAAGHGRTLTAALMAAMESANDALYVPHDARRGPRPITVGLSALAVREADGYLIQAGPGQALVVQQNDVTAIPPLDIYRHLLTAATLDTRGHPTPLGAYPEVEPDLFHVDAQHGLFAVLCATSLGRVLYREDDGVLCGLDAADAAEYLVSLGRRYRLPQAYGVVLATGDDHHKGPVATLLAYPAYPADEENLNLPPHHDAPDRWDTPDDADDDAEQRWEYLGEPATPARHAPRFVLPSFGRRPPRRPVAIWGETRTVRRGLPNLPPRLWILIAAIAFTLLLAGILSVGQTVTGHQANEAAKHDLDAVAAGREQAKAIGSAQDRYTALLALSSRLDKVGATGRQTTRVARERQLQATALDAAANITRVAPKAAATLTHLDPAPGNHRLILAGDDGVVYLYDRNEKGDWAVASLDATGKKMPLFAPGSVASKVPASELRGLFWLGGPATTDRTRLFYRLGTGQWAETTVAAGEKRPAAVAFLGDSLYLLDAAAGQIVRVPLKEGAAAKPLTADTLAPELRGAVDLASDGQILWVLLGDGRIRGFAPNGVTAPIALPLVPPLAGPTAMATSASSPYLYIAESGQGRILRVRKSDAKVLQVLAAGDGTPPLTAIQGLSVDEAHGTLWCVTADGVLSVPLPPVQA